MPGREPGSVLIPAETPARYAGSATSRIRLGGTDRGTGIIGWSLRGLPPHGSFDHLVGIPTTRSTSTSDSAIAPPATHPNGVTAIDHIVLLSPDLDRTVASLAAADLAPRREQDTELGGRPIRQVFFRLGEVILEVVGSPGSAGDGPRRCGESPTSSPTSTRQPSTSATTPRRSKTPSSRAGGSARSGTRISEMSVHTAVISATPDR